MANRSLRHLQSILFLLSRRKGGVAFSRIPRGLEGRDQLFLDVDYALRCIGSSMCVSETEPHSIMCKGPVTQMGKLIFDTVIQFFLGSKGTAGLHPFLYAPKAVSAFRNPHQSSWWSRGPSTCGLMVTWWSLGLGLPQTCPVTH